MKKLLFLAGVLLITGCAGVNYAVENYSKVAIQKFDYSGDVWRIFDKPEESRLMITPSLGRAAGGGFIKGATLGLAKPARGKEPHFRKAAQAFLNARGGNCTTGEGKLVVDPQYEYFYTCK